VTQLDAYTNKKNSRNPQAPSLYTPLLQRRLALAAAEPKNLKFDIFINIIILLIMQVVV
jgi:hypothetical protein